MIDLLLFETAWGKATKSIFRLESLPEYKVPEDLKKFKLFLEGKPYKDAGHERWQSKLSETSQKGIIIQRVRLFLCLYLII